MGYSNPESQAGLENLIGTRGFEFSAQHCNMFASRLITLVGQDVSTFRDLSRVASFSNLEVANDDFRRRK